LAHCLSACLRTAVRNQVHLIFAAVVPRTPVTRLPPPPAPPPLSFSSCAGAGLTDGRGLFFGGGMELFFIQLLALVVCAVWSAGLTWIIVEGMQRAGVQLRPPEGHEEHGIDFVSHGER
jgi:hypothetical protein